ncbi:MAG: S8 family serine peptidase, partial [Pseudomonadota bacterium]
MERSVFFKGAIIAGLSAVLAGCGGGGGGGGLVSVTPPTPSNPPSFPSPSPTIPSSPPTVPTTPTTPGFNEFDTNYGLAAVNADSAYALGATGDGVRVAVIDSGIDTDHPDLDGQIATGSIDIITNTTGTLDDVDGHGTAVSSVIASELNGVGPHGVAYQAEILAIRADTPGSCATSCSYSDTNLANAVDYAVAQGA